MQNCRIVLHSPPSQWHAPRAFFPARRYQVRRLADGEDYALKHIDLQVGRCRSVPVEEGVLLPPLRRVCNNSQFGVQRSCCCRPGGAD